jgi:hypothetical protein
MKYKYIDIDESTFEDEIIGWLIFDKLTHWNVRCWIAGNECFVDGRIEVEEVDECCVELKGGNMDAIPFSNYGEIHDIVKHTFKTKYHDEIIEVINQAINEDRQEQT